MNYYEAKFIVALLDYILTIVELKKMEKAKLEGVDVSEIEDYSIGVIVPYKAQENLMHKFITEEKLDSLKGVQISTVDAF